MNFALGPVGPIAQKPVEEVLPPEIGILRAASKQKPRVKKYLKNQYFPAYTEKGMKWDSSKWDSSTWDKID